MGRESNADLAPALELEHLMPTAAIQRDRIRPWRLAALLVSETTPLMAASRYASPLTCGALRAMAGRAGGRQKFCGSTGVE